MLNFLAQPNINMRTIALLACLFSSVFAVHAQNPIGIPDILNYSKNEYNAGMQNWEMVQGDNGIMYFANTEGLLSFDGSTWNLFHLPEKAYIRSIALGNDGKIYAGGQNEFGFFTADGQGRLYFTSLRSQIAENLPYFSDVWDIVANGNDIFFRSKSEIFYYDGSRVTTYPAQKEWRFAGRDGNSVIAQDQQNGLMRYNHGAWKEMTADDDLPKGYLVTAAVSFGKDSTLVTTLNSGLYILHNEKLERLPLSEHSALYNKLILNAARVNPGQVAVGTNQGCFIINNEGEVVQVLSKNEGLQNNTVLSLFLDKSSNLWLGLENGIGFIAYNNAIKHIYPQTQNEGIGYSSILYNNELYLGTSIGLYKVPVTGPGDLSLIRENFQSIPSIEGSAWSLSEVNGKLLMGHHEGAFEIAGDKAVPITRQTGYWTFLPLEDVFQTSYVIAGNYNGLDFFQLTGDHFTPKGNLVNFNESSRFLAMDNHKMIWAAHPYRGIFRIDMNEIDKPVIKLYGKEQGLPSSVRNNLYRIKNRVVVTTEKGVYEYDRITDSFVESSWFKNFLGQKNIKYLKEDNAGNIWFIEDRSLGVVDFSGKTPAVIYFPELTGKVVMNFPHINPIDRNNVLLGSEKGFYHINYEQYKKTKTPLEVGIRTVRVIGSGDSILFGGYNEKNAVEMQVLDDDLNSLHFEFSSPTYERQASLEYSYRLKGFDREWSSWIKKSEKEYTNLAPGEYSFEVKAKSNLGNESQIRSYSFKILPPWYAAPMAFVVYILLLAGVVYLLYRMQQALMIRQQKKHEEEQKHLQYVHQLEMEKSEKEIIALRNRQLTHEIGSKNSELASVAMHLVQKGELLAKIKDELIRLKKSPSFDPSAHEFRKIIKIFNAENEMDKDWEMFASHFDNVHGDFLAALRETYPMLTLTDLKLSAYLRMNLTSKEIAKLLNITVRGVEISRYRLRKKLGIATEVSLYSFFSNFKNRNEAEIKRQDKNVPPVFT